VLLSFLTWAYYGDYHSNGDGTVPSSVSTEADTNGFEHAFGSTATKRCKKDKKKQASATMIGYSSWLPQSEAPTAVEPLLEKPSTGNGEGRAEEASVGSLKDTSVPLVLAIAEDNFLYPLLLHVKLYVFADAYLIEPLKATAKQKMIDQLQKLGSLSEGDERAAVFDILLNKSHVLTLPLTLPLRSSCHLASLPPPTTSCFEIMISDHAWKSSFAMLSNAEQC
jgi:hypothetical protein